MTAKRWNPLIRVSYRILGGLIPDLPSYREVYYDKSGMRLSYKAYFSLTLLISIILFVSSFSAASYVHSKTLFVDPTDLFSNEFNMYLLLALPSFYTVILPSLLLAFILSASAFTAFLIFPIYRKWDDERRIDNALFDTISLAATLSSGGVSLETLIDHLTEIATIPAVAKMFRRISRNLKALGLDIASAVKEAVEHCPSTHLSRILEGMLNASQTSGELTPYLDFEVKQLMDMKREKLDKKISTLAYMGELYVSALVVGPIMMILAVSLVSLFGGTMFGYSPIAQINIVVFFVIPVLACVFAVLIGSIVGEGEM